MSEQPSETTQQADTTPQDRPAPETAEAEVQRAESQRPAVKQATFRMPRIAIVAAFLAMMTATPLAWSSWYLTTVYLLPIGFIVWVWRNQTTVDAENVTARTTFGKRVISWDELQGLALTKRAKVQAVLADDTRVPLPGVRTRHLPMLAVFSGGRIADPTKPAGDPAPQQD